MKKENPSFNETIKILNESIKNATLFAKQQAKLRDKLLRDAAKNKKS